MLVSDEQFSKAETPIFLRPEGSVTVLISLHPLNALFPTLSTPSEITTDFI